MNESKMPLKQLCSYLKLILGLGLVLFLISVLCHRPFLESPIILSTIILRDVASEVKCPEKNAETDPKSYFHLNQDEGMLLEYVSRNILEPPLLIPYNLSNPFADPAQNEPQYRVALHLLDYKKNGIFVEAGANNGETLSNTLVLERDFGWTGLLVEPDSKAYAGLRSKHRKSWLANVCLSTKKSLMTVAFEEAKASVMSKALGIGTQDQTADPDYFKNSTTKLCVPLYSLLAPLNLTVIDYFSLDVEGMDLQVLKTIPFDKIHIKVMSIEVDKVGVEGYTELLQIMKDKDFILATKIKEYYADDHIFAHRSVLSKPCAAKYCGVV